MHELIQRKTAEERSGETDEKLRQRLSFAAHFANRAVFNVFAQENEFAARSCLLAVGDEKVLDFARTKLVHCKAVKEKIGILCVIRVQIVIAMAHADPHAIHLASLFDARDLP